MIKTKHYKINVLKLMTCIVWVWVVASLIMATIQLNTLGI